MEEIVENAEESAPKRSRSDEDIVNKDKELSSSSDSGQQSPHDKHHISSACINNNNTNISNNNDNINHISNCSDSGLSSKMEDSSCGDIDITVENNKPDDNEFDLIETMITSVEAKMQQEKEKMQTALDIADDKGAVGGGDGDKPSTSAMLIKRHKRNRSRNYRTAGRSSSSSSANSSSEQPETTEREIPQQEQDDNSETQDIIENNPASPTSSFPDFLGNLSVPSDDSSSSDDTDSINDDNTDFEPSLFDDRFSPENASPDSADSNRLKEKDEEVNKLLNKPKPAYTWSASYELMRREHGLSGDGRTSLRNGFTYGFKNRFYASRHIVERMKLSHDLRKHSGCVNCLNFNKTGDLLVTGSDDARLIVWNWAGNKTKHVWKSGHSANIFQSKFLPSSSCIDIISAGRDGRVRRSVIPPSGGKVQVSHLYVHAGAVHKLVISPENPSEIISVGEDGYICSKDLRDDNPKADMLKVFSSTKKTKTVHLFSISHHPFAPEICVSGSDRFVRVYDKRSMSDPVYTMCPEHILETNSHNVTCCVYNNSGTEILATYSEDNIYLFNNRNYVTGEYIHSYKGHYNQKTIKGVNFFGPNSEYVISGSDCGNIFYWDKNTEAIINFMHGDSAGVVNCLEPHPSAPILATSGLEHNIKIWTPSAEKHPPDLTKLTHCVRRNIRRTVIDEGTDFDNSQLQFFIRRMLWRSRRRQRSNRNENGLESDGDDIDDDDDDNDTSDDSLLPDVQTDEDDDEDASNFRRLSCGTQ